ncbi:MAG TPA: hypothetical protein VMW62_08175 [Chloroflexota bacterium]|nr:hypothetical protein [Chloroflexota bacterium]
MDAPSAISPPSDHLDTMKDEPDLQPCPNCGHEMPALKGARLSVCPVCGYKESCCY